MRRYRVDVFDRAFTFKDMAQTSEPTLIVDYLVQSSSQVQIPKKMNISIGDYAQIRDEDGAMFQGIVTNFTYDGKLTELTLAQMSKLLDVEVFADVSGLASGIEAWMDAQLTAVYNGTDAAQNLTGLTITRSTTTAGSYPANDQGIYNLYDLAVHFFKVYGVIIDVGFDIPTQKVTFNFRVVNTGSIWKLETKLKDVAEYSVNSSTLMEYPNKMIIKSEDGLSTETYYWHPSGFSGTVDTDGSTNRVQPVLARCAIVQPEQGQTFTQAAYIEAVNQMYQSQYDDQIEIMFNSSSKLVEVGKIGQLYTIIDGNNSYNTVLTGYQRLNDKFTRMTFGYVRSRLTQILQQERRRNL